MSKWKRRLKLNTEFAFLERNQGGAIPRHCLVCCDGAREARPYIPRWFEDEHYPEDNGFYYNYFGNAVGPRWHWCPWCGHEIEYDRWADIEVHPDEMEQKKK